MEYIDRLINNLPQKRTEISKEEMKRSKLRSEKASRDLFYSLMKNPIDLEGIQIKLLA